MHRRFIIGLLVWAVLGPSLGQAAHIIWVNEGNQELDGTPIDQGFVDTLLAAGYDVDYRVDAPGIGYWRVLDETKMAELNAADLVIISRGVESLTYNDPEGWNGLEVPLINMSAFHIRSSRIRWIDSTAIANIRGPFSVKVPEHPIFKGIALAGNQFAAVTAETSFLGPAPAGNGTILATEAGSGATAIELWDAGVEFYDGSGQVAGAKRMFLALGQRGALPTDAGRYTVTDAGAQLFLNAVKYMLGAPPCQASKPSPVDESVDVLREGTVLNWEPGEGAVSHNIYFGTVFDDVNSADAASALNISPGQPSVGHALPRLEFGQTYFWRVDEILEDSTVCKGVTWRFTVEPFSVVVTPVAANSSGQFGDSGPEKTIDGSGLVENRHGTAIAGMYLSVVLPATIVYEFDKVYKLHEMWVWNSNSEVETEYGFGAMDVVVELSQDGSTYTPLEGVAPFAQAPGMEGYAHNTTVAFNGATAKFVRLTIHSVQGFATQAGLSEVRFYAIPVFASHPQPADGAGVDDIHVTLAWRPGRGAVRHRVFLDTAQATTLLDTVDVNSLETTIELEETYAWKIVEVNAPEEHAGDIWTFTGPDYAVIEDFEDYTDDQDAGLAIFQSWTDGWKNPANGSQAGYAEKPYAEQSIVRSGRQSMPMHFDNTGSTTGLSEVTRTFAEAQDWSGASLQSLLIPFRLDAGNSGGGRLYAKLNDTPVTYPGDLMDIPLGWDLFWMQWNIDLKALGITSVQSLTLGVDGADAKGILYLDDIRLYKNVPDQMEIISVIEAESGTVTAPMEIFSDDSTASGGRYIGTTEDVGNANSSPPADGIATYSLNVPADGVYKLALRMAERDSDSFWIRIPSASTSAVNLVDGFFKCNRMPGSADWQWLVARNDDDDGDLEVEFTLTAGTHTLELRRREDGTMLDAIALLQ